MSKMNIPNKLTILRVLLVPVFMACYLYIEDVVLCSVISVLVFGLTALTDALDGKIARKYNLVTNFGKFLDPVADKFMVFASLTCITVKSYGILQNVLVWALMLVFLRELGVTSIRLVCVNSGAGVIAASIFGKLKTVSQCLAIVVLIVEPAICEGFDVYLYNIPSYIVVALFTFMTVASGIDYVKTYYKYLNPNE